MVGGLCGRTGFQSWTRWNLILYRGPDIPVVQNFKERRGRLRFREITVNYAAHVARSCDPAGSAYWLQLF